MRSRVSTSSAGTATLRPCLEQVVGQVFGHLLGEGGDQDPLAARRPAASISAMRSSIWPLVGRTTTSGSTRPVGRTICSTTWLECDISYAAGRGRHEDAPG